MNLNENYDLLLNEIANNEEHLKSVLIEKYCTEEKLLHLKGQEVLLKEIVTSERVFSDRSLVDECNSKKPVNE